MNKSYRFVESNSGKSNVTIFIPGTSTDLYSSNTLFLSHEKEYRNQNEKNAISFFSNNYWFSCYCRFLFLAPDGWYLLAFVV
jgi:protein associated with RNAse G/E